MKRNRVPFVVLTLSFLVFPFVSPSDPVGARLVPPSRETGLFESPAAWTGKASHRPRLVSDSDLAAALGGHRQGFGLFPAETRDKARRELLEKLPFGVALQAAADRNGVDGLLLAAVVEAESRFKPDRVSPKGAVGLMQIMPATAASFGKERTDLFDPHVNLDVGSRYLDSLIDTYDGDLKVALAAYNAGPGAVARYGGVPPYRETRAYVLKVLALYDDHRQSVEGKASRS